MKFCFPSLVISYIILLLSPLWKRHFLIFFSKRIKPENISTATSFIIIQIYLDIVFEEIINNLDRFSIINVPVEIHELLILKELLCHKVKFHSLQPTNLGNKSSSALQSCDPVGQLPQTHPLLRFRVSITSNIDILYSILSIGKKIKFTSPDVLGYSSSVYSI